MKKSFVYLIIALMLATMLCGCGMDSDDGIVGNSPRPTETITASPSMLPEVSPSVIPETDNSFERSNPQVGASDGAKTSPNVTDNKNS